MSQHLVRMLSIGVIGFWLMIIVFIPIALIGFGEAPIDFYRSILPEEALTGRTGYLVPPFGRFEKELDVWYCLWCLLGRW